MSNKPIVLQIVGAHGTGKSTACEKIMAKYGDKVDYYPDLAGEVMMKNFRTENPAENPAEEFWNCIKTNKLIRPIDFQFDLMLMIQDQLNYCLYTDKQFVLLDASPIRVLAYTQYILKKWADNLCFDGNKDLYDAQKVAYKLAADLIDVIYNVRIINKKLDSVIFCQSAQIGTLYEIEDSPDRVNVWSYRKEIQKLCSELCNSDEIHHRSRAFWYDGDDLYEKIEKFIENAGEAK